jgi:uncharacterized DUF497 family protein
MLGGVRFEWDPKKDEASRLKHDLSFEEAGELFTSGVDYLEIFDEAHSADEERFIAMGPIQRGLVVVVWTERVEDIVRIVSARWATRREQELYRKYVETNL